MGTMTAVREARVAVSDVALDVPDWRRIWADEVIGQKSVRGEEYKAEPEPCAEQRWITVQDPQHGGFQSVLTLCGKWRGRRCQYCFNARKKEFQERIKRAVAYGSVYCLPLNDERVPQLMRELGKHGYLRLPANIPCGGYFFYNATGRQKLGTQIQSTRDVPDVVWDALTDTPDGKRPSGRLGTLDLTDAEKRSSEEWDTVHCRGVLTPTDSDSTARRAQAACIAEQKTADLDPITKEQLEGAIDLRTRVFIEELRQRSVPILGLVSMERFVHLPSVNWHLAREQNSSL